MAVGSLLLALSDLDAGWGLALGGAAGIAALGVALGPPRSRALLFATVNLAVLGLYAWAAEEREALEIRLAGSTVDVRTAEGRVEARDVAIGEGVVAIELLDQSTRRGAQLSRPDEVPGPLHRLLLWPRAGLLAGVVPVEASGAASLRAPERPIWQPLWDAGPAPSTVGNVGPGEGRLRFELIRPNTAVRLLIGAGDRSSGVLVHLRPENRELSLLELRDGRIRRELAGGALVYRRPLDGAIRSLIRELGQTWLWALLLLATSVTAARLWPTPVRYPRLPYAALMAVLALLALGTTLFIARVILEGIPHVQDSVAYLWQAKTIATGRLWLELPPRPEFFEHEFVLQTAGRWFSKYPPGAALALLPGVLAGVPWAVSPVLAALTLLLVYDVGRRAYGPGVGALAALLLALSPFFLFMSGTMMGHPFGLFLTMASLACAARASEGEGNLRAAAACGLALGLLAMTRALTALALLAPIGGWLLAHQAHRPLRLVQLALAVGLGSAPAFVGWLWYNAAVVGDPTQNTMTQWWTFDRLGFGPDVGMHGGHDLPRGLTNTRANLSELNRHLFGWPFYLTLAASMVPLLAPGRSRWDWWLGAVTLATTGAYVFWWADGIMYGPRYFYEAIGALALLSARGLAILAAALGPVRGSTGAAAGSYAVACLAAGLLVAHNLLLYLPPQLTGHRGYNGIDRSRLDAVERAGLRDALVFVTEGPTGWQGYGSVFPANSPHLDGPVVYARDLGDGRNRELLRLFPGRRGYVLTGPTLRPLADP
jgi:Dolichyl-phosphate-mannose-protein mannosyltransferase